MANALFSNPIRVDTAATVIAANSASAAQPCAVQLIQWCDEHAAAGGAIADNDDLTMTINGTTVGLQVAGVIVASQPSTMSALVWEAVLNPPVLIDTLSVGAIDGGTVYIWKA